jgi:hypothetical protein
MSLNRITSSTTKVRNAILLADSVLSRVPVLTNATKSNIVALTRQQELKNTAVSDSLKQLSGRIKQMEISDQIESDLSNFKPQIIESAVQRRRQTNSQVEGGAGGSRNTRSSAKSRLLKGPDPLVAAIANTSKNLLALGLERTKLNQNLNRIESQINSLSAAIQALTNTGAAQQQIAEYERRLEEFSAAYDRTKDRIEQLQELYRRRSELLRKLRLKKEETQKKFSNNYDRLLKALNIFKEIPKRLRFPKLPKLPTVNVRKSNLRMRIRDAVDVIKKNSQKASKLSIEQAKKDSSEKIRDERNMDAIQRSISRSRQAIVAARNKYEASVTAKNTAIETVVQNSQNEVRRLRAGIIDAQRQLNNKIDLSAAAANSSILKIKDAKIRAERADIV